MKCDLSLYRYRLYHRKDCYVNFAVFNGLRYQLWIQVSELTFICVKINKVFKTRGIHDNPHVGNLFFFTIFVLFEGHEFITLHIILVLSEISRGAASVKQESNYTLTHS
jgi:hypothetical protein